MSSTMFAAACGPEMFVFWLMFMFIALVFKAVSPLVVALFFVSSLVGLVALVGGFIFLVIAAIRSIQSTHLSTGSDG